MNPTSQPPTSQYCRAKPQGSTPVQRTQYVVCATVAKYGRPGDRFCFLDKLRNSMRSVTFKCAFSCSFCSLFKSATAAYIAPSNVWSQLSPSQGQRVAGKVTPMVVGGARSYNICKSGHPTLTDVESTTPSEDSQCLGTPSFLERAESPLWELG